MNASDAYDPNDRFALTPAGDAYLDACDDDDAEDPAAGGAYGNDLAPLDDGDP